MATLVHSGAGEVSSREGFVSVFSDVPCRKVAAVCYRRTNSRIEFLLVNTDAGRWTFPKGSIDDGMTEPCAAEQEAFEEAGVTGRIEQAHFDFYLHVRKNREYVVKAFLLEVWDTDRPLEPHRTPVWCTPEQAKRRLMHLRPSKYGHELCRIVDRAVTRLST
jgi:8-oxo-dGTP pyrophosphatase MutT (NUDIX family)